MDAYEVLERLSDAPLVPAAPLSEDELIQLDAQMRAIVKAECGEPGD